ncbi:aminotransferase class V-fold PLP-dependent enzyme [Amphibacillus sediminis]|uniref:aminotransferase class V-fold PLP-dependent enzyme n=1 Tax=Amphibacillus sediminis TaxID=360185 RepID=UPI00082C92CE|nr:aminotransferase class V-fold PLP-dependent enzyme [Amphibacillus sediminis]
MSQTNQDLEHYFNTFRKQTIGIDQTIQTPYGRYPLIYMDWTASGRLYRPIEKKMIEVVGPWISNTHTEHSSTGQLMTECYHHAKQIIRAHVNASEDDLILPVGSGTTDALNKLQRLISIRVPASLNQSFLLEPEQRPVIFTSLMEHHSNYLSWCETIGDVVVIPLTKHHQIDQEQLEHALIRYQDRPVKIGAFTACSNVTGIQTNYNQLAKLMHQYNGLCFIDFAASAPYVPINMHPNDELSYLDGIAFSAHKFLGGPGASGILIVNRHCLTNDVPDQPGGGTVLFTNKWGDYQYLHDIEAREDGGTPAILQTIRAALAIQLKEKMTTKLIDKREQEMMQYFLPRLAQIRDINILAYPVQAKRLGIISFVVKGKHHHLIAKLLNDRFGIQVRSGCACAGPYGHSLLNLSKAYSNKMVEMFKKGDQSFRPGWIRISLHPIIQNQELDYLLYALQNIVEHYDTWAIDYHYDKHSDKFSHRFSSQNPSLIRALYDE